MKKLIVCFIAVLIVGCSDDKLGGDGNSNGFKGFGENAIAGINEIPGILYSCSISNFGIEFLLRGSNFYLSLNDLYNTSSVTLWEEMSRRGNHRDRLDNALPPRAGRDRLGRRRYSDEGLQLQVKRVFIVTSNNPETVFANSTRVETIDRFEGGINASFNIRFNKARLSGGLRLESGNYVESRKRFFCREI